MSHEASTWVWSQDLPAGAKLVLLAVADHADKTGFCWPGVEGLADKCKVSERTVWRQIAELEKLGALCRMRRATQAGRRSNSYQIHINDDCQFCNMTILQRDTTGTSNVTPMSGCIKGKESSIESPGPSEGIQQLLDRSGLPDWYVDLYSIEGFELKYAECQTWLDGKGISEAHANQTAASLRSQWPGQGPKGRPKWTDVWATFRTWVQRPPLNGASPTREVDPVAKHRQDAAERARRG